MKKVIVMYKNSGFTLMELMVTIVILAIITALAAPAFGKMVARKKLDMVAKDLSLVFGDSRAKATALRRDVTIDFSCTTSCESTATTLYWKSDNPDVRLNGDKTAVVFTAIGLAKRNNKITSMDFELCHVELGESRTVSISKVGTVDAITQGSCS